WPLAQPVGQRSRNLSKLSSLLTKGKQVLKIVCDLTLLIERLKLAVLRPTGARDGPDAVTVGANPRDRYHRHDHIRRIPLRVT
ncbi:hypothetical protein, partial [Burkholderia ambifaria]|uniref:hypothetical protein n=1 Tax=Burkholderia ambifaria TaxID=152480 RepID=UPI001ABA0FBC